MGDFLPIYDFSRIIPNFLKLLPLCSCADAWPILEIIPTIKLAPLYNTRTSDETYDGWIVANIGPPGVSKARRHLFETTKLIQTSSCPTRAFWIASSSSCGQREYGTRERPAKVRSDQQHIGIKKRQDDWKDMLICIATTYWMVANRLGMVVWEVWICRVWCLVRCMVILLRLAMSLDQFARFAGLICWFRNDAVGVACLLICLCLWSYHWHTRRYASFGITIYPTHLNDV